jgi:7-cyano-7-deazaguanine reductase
MKKDNVSSLTKLGEAGTKYKYDSPDKKMLEVFDNTFPDRDYTVNLIFHEFTSLCPKTGQPDFAIITIEYVPDLYCIETKSLKVYFLSYRNQGAFMETITNQILCDCADVCKPRWMKVTSKFNVRGGTSIRVCVEYRK